MSQPGMLSHGLPPRDNDVQRAIADMQRQINQLSGALVQATNTANHALSQMAAYNWYTGNFAVSTTGTVVINQSLTVPSGFSKLAFFAGGSATAHNAYSGVDSLSAYIIVGALSSGDVFASTAAGTNATISPSLAGELTGLTAGSTVQVKLQLNTSNANWPATSGSIASLADLSIMAIWQV